MRILLLTQVVPFPPDSGPKIKTYNVLRYLAQKHEVHLVSFTRDPREEAGAESLRNICATVTTVPLRRSQVRDAVYLLQSLINGQPFLVQRDESESMRAAIASLVNRYAFDAVHADQFSMAQFAVNLAVPLRVLDEHNAVWTIVRRATSRERWGPRRILAELEWRKVRGYEGQMCRRFDRVTVVSKEDRLALEQAAGTSFPTSTIPIAVDTEELAFRSPSPDAKHLVSIATMFYPPNAAGIYWFGSEVFPLVRQAVPDTEFYVVGSRPPKTISDLARTGSGIVVTGYVPNLTPILREAAVLVVPVHSGSGMRVKILEGLARGIPIVSTTIGAEGIDVRAGDHLLIADEPRAFAAAVTRILQEPGEAARMAAAGRDLVVTRYDWRTALSELDEVYGPATVPAAPAAVAEPALQALG